MSGQPNIEEIRKLHLALRERSKYASTFERASRQAKLQQEDADAAAAACAECDREIVKLLEAMDCGPGGNFGSERRLILLLTTLTQLE